MADNQCSILRGSVHSSGLTTFVILRAIDWDDLSPGKAPERSWLRILSEIAAAGLTCSAAGLSGFVAFGSTAATPLTIGGSSPVAYLSGAAFVATSLQCGNSILRAGGEIFSTGFTDDLDSNEWYSATSKALDAISLVGVTTAASATIRSVLLVRRATGRPLFQILRTLSRAERKRLAEELVRFKAPGVSNKKMKMLFRVGQHAKIFKNSEILPVLKLKLIDGLAASLSFTSSGVAGVVNDLVVYVYQEP